MNNINKAWLWRSLTVIIALLTAYNAYLLSDKPYGFLFFSQLALPPALLLGLTFQYGLRQWKNEQRKTAAIFIALPTLVTLAFAVTLLIVASNSTQELSKQQWREDLRQLSRLLTEEYPNINTMIEPNDFQSRVKAIDHGIDRWSSDRITVEFMGLVASLNDGHTFMAPSMQFRQPPLVIRKFKDGFYIINTSRALSLLDNAKVLNIDGVPIDEVYARVTPYIGGENEGIKLDRFEMYGLMTDLLFQLGISNDPGKFELTYSSQGKVLTETIPGKSLLQWGLFYFKPKPLGHLPYGHQINSPFYSISRMDEGRILYINISVLKDMPGLAIADFVTDIKAALNDDYEKVIVDLRQNRGGDNFKSRQVAAAFRDSAQANQPNRLFVLTSRRTYSAAVNLASQLENQTLATFVGQPTGQGPNQQGDAIVYQLENSELSASISSVIWRGSFRNDTRQAIYPHQIIEYTHQDYLLNYDPALEWVKNFSPVAQKPRATADDFPVGHYFVDKQFLARIYEKDSSLLLSIDDYSQISLNKILTPIYQADNGFFQTQLRHIKLRLDDENKPMLLCEDEAYSLIRVDDEFQTPFQMINNGKILEGVKALRQNKAYHYMANHFPLQKKGEELIALGQYDKAIAIFDYIREREPKNTAVSSLLSQAQSQVGRNKP